MNTPKSILKNKDKLRQVVLKTTPLWKAELFAKYGNKTLLDELRKSANISSNAPKANLSLVVNSEAPISNLSI